MFDSSHASMKVVDLSHPFDNSTLYWPSMKADSFRFTNKQRSGSGSGVGSTFYSSNVFSAAEHGGTHLDAPIHFAEGKRTVGKIPITDLIANVLIIDVKKDAASNRDYLIQESDFLGYEKEYGRIADGSILLLNTGKPIFYILLQTSIFLTTTRAILDNP